MNSTLENYFPVEESTLITILAFLGLILAPVTIFCNILVIIPFCRCSRVRSASNQILLALAITDCILGFLLFLVSITGLTKITRVDEPNAYCHINYAVAMGMTTLQATSLLLMVANSGDKALSLLRPLHYNEIVTFTSVNIYICFSIILSVIIGVIIPITFFDILHDSINEGDYFSYMLIPLGLGAKPLLQSYLMASFTLPCGLIVALCHFYVYTVASKHAKAMKRDDSVNDRMQRNSASYKLATTSEAVALGLNNGGFSMPVTMPTNNFLTIPSPQNNQLTETVASNNNHNRTNSSIRSKRNLLMSCNDSSNTSSTINSRYGTSLLIGVIFIFATRLPSQLTPFILPEKSDSTFNQILYVLLNLPLLICSLLNPWMYAYHNLDLKPVMRRLVKKFCRKIVRKDYHGNEARFRKGACGNAENQSFMTGYNAGQISMFASVPRRSTFLHNSAGGAAVLATTPVVTAPIQPPIHPVLKTQRSVSSMLRNSLTKTKKARRTKSCALNNQGGKIPIVKIWDGNTVKDVTKPDEEML